MGRRRKTSKIGGAFIAHSLEMRRSLAWRSLPDNARRVLDRLELEHMSKGGEQNGELICTYDDFARAGIRRKSVALAIRQAQALGFLAVVRGYRTAGADKAPSLYRLTYVYGREGSPEPTNDWRTVVSPGDVDEALRFAMSRTLPENYR